MKFLDNYKGQYFPIWTDKKYYALPAKNGPRWKVKILKDPNRKAQKKSQIKNRNLQDDVPFNPSCLRYSIKVIDPSSLSYQELQTICEKNNLPPSMVKGAPNRPIFRDDMSLKQLIDAFLSLYPKNTRNQYQRSLESTFKLTHPILQEINYLDNSAQKIMEEHAPLILKELGKLRRKELIQSEDISPFKAFMKFWKNKEKDQFKKKSSRTSTKRYNVKKNSNLSSNEFNAFLKELKIANLRDFLVAKLIRELNHTLDQAAYVPVEAVLRIKLSDVSYDPDILIYRVQVEKKLAREYGYVNYAFLKISPLL